jgi:hypothetical protein
MNIDTINDSNNNIKQYLNLITNNEINDTLNDRHKHDLNLRVHKEGIDTVNDSYDPINESKDLVEDLRS